MSSENDFIIIEFTDSKNENLGNNCYFSLQVVLLWLNYFDRSMLDFIVLGITGIAAWFNISPAKPNLQPLEAVAWEESAVFQLPKFDRDRTSIAIADNYLENLTQQGFDRDLQGVWVQSGWDVSASNLGKTPLPAASLTKIATTLAALSKWGAKHQFNTNVYVTGEIDRGIVTGDLIIEGNGDPLFVWEEAIALGKCSRSSWD